MLTKIVLEGPMGKEFGRTWNLQANSPNEALRMIDANKPGVMRWIRMNLEKYSHYKVICEYEDGRSEHLTEQSYGMERQCKSIRFVPVLKGSGGVFQAIVGVVLIVAGAISEQPWMIAMGAGMLIGGVAAMLAPKAKTDSTERKDKTSYYFDGPANTSTQGVPVQLIYGKCMVGSHAISAAVTVDQLM